MPPIRDLIDVWASMYANSAVLRSGLAFAHIGALLSGGGSALAADLGTLTAARLGAGALPAELQRLRRVHRIVAASLTIVLVSGLLLVGADLDAYLSSTVFWLKMLLVAALIVNGALLIIVAARAASGDPAAVRRLRLISMASLLLWFSTTLLGAALPNAL